jgi:regulator of replication initiation timing
MGIEFLSSITKSFRDKDRRIIAMDREIERLSDEIVKLTTKNNVLKLKILKLLKALKKDEEEKEPPDDLFLAGRAQQLALISRLLPANSRRPAPL